ncbi:MerR family transcriptional regulator, partial [Patescibacteria group bacterium]
MSTKKTYTISEVSNILGVSSKTLRRWEKKGSVSPIRTLGNQRRYTETDIAILKQKLQKTTPYLPEPTKKINAFSKDDLIAKLGITSNTINRWEKEGKIQTSQNESGKQYSLPQGFDSTQQTTIPSKEKTPQKEEKQPEVENTKSQKSTPNDFLRYFVPSSVAVGIVIIFLILLSRVTNQQPLPEERSQAGYFPRPSSSPKYNQNTSGGDVGYFLGGKISIGSDEGSISSLDQDGNLNLNTGSASIAQDVTVGGALNLIPHSQPTNPQVGSIYLDQTTNQLAYFNGSEWIYLDSTTSESIVSSLQTAYSGGNTINTTSQDLSFTLADTIGTDADFLVNIKGDSSKAVFSGQAGESLLTIDPQLSRPIQIDQPTQISGNLYSPKLIDSNNESYYLDPSSSSTSLKTMGGIEIGGPINFSSSSNSLTNNSDYITFSQGLSIGDDTTYYFDKNGNISANNGYFKSDLFSEDLTSAGAVTLGDGGDSIGLSGTTITLNDSNLTSAVTLTDSSTSLDSGDTAIIDAINTIYALAAGGGSGIWDNPSGVIYPQTITDDFAIGGTTSSAPFFVDNSGNVTIDGNTTLGDAATDSITFNAVAGSTFNMNSYAIQNIGATGTDFTGTGGLNLADSLSVTGTVTGTTLTDGTASITAGAGSGFSTLTTSGNINTTAGDIQTNSASRIDSSGNLTNIGTTQLNTVTYSWPGADGSTSYILATNGSGTLSWQDPAVVAGGTVNWDVANGAISPINKTIDFLIGSSSSASAKFAVLNVNSGTTTASISAGAAGASYLTASGNLQTTALQNLVLGGFTTGGITLDENIIISGTSDLLGNADITGTLDSSGNITSLSTVQGSTITDGTATFTGGDLTGVGGITMSGTLDIGTNTIADGNFNGDWAFNSGNLSGITNLTTTGTTSFNTVAYTWPGADGTSDYVLSTNGSGTLSWQDPSVLTESSNHWAIQNGAIFTKNTSMDFFLGSGASASAKFAVLNIDSGTPTASVSAGESGGSYLTADGNLAATAMQNLTFGGSTTGGLIFNEGAWDLSNQTVDISLNNAVDALNFDSNTLSIDASSNRVGVGVANPQAILDVQGATGTDLFRLTGTGAGATNYKMNISTGGTLQFVNNSTAMLYMKGGTSFQTYYMNHTFNESGGNYDFTIEGQNDAQLFKIDASEDTIGIGLTSPEHKLEIGGGYAGNALVSLNEINGNDILTASASGTTRATLTNTGSFEAADLVLGLNDASANISTEDTDENLTIDPNGAGDIYFHGSTYVISDTGDFTLGGLITFENDEYIDGQTDDFISLVGTGGTADVDLDIDLDGVGPVLTSTAADTIFVNENFQVLNDLNVFSGNIQTGAAATTRITNAGNLSNIGTTQFNTVTYTWPGADGSADYVLSTNGSGTLSWVAQSGGGGSTYWSLQNGALFPTNNTTDFLIGSDASSSAKFAVLNIDSGTPTASVSASEAGAAYLTADGSLQTTALQNLTIGGATTGGITLNENIVVTGTSALGGNTDITGTLSVTSTSDFQDALANSTGNLILDDTIDLGSPTTGINITPAGVISDIDGNLSLLDNTDITGTLSVTSTSDLQGNISNSTGNLVLDDTTDIGSVANGLNIDTSGNLSDNNGNVVINDVVDLGSATTGLNITTAGVVTDTDGNIVLNDTVDLGSATTGINITTAGTLSDSDGNISINDSVDITGSLTTTINADFAGTLTSGTGNAFNVDASGNIDAGTWTADVVGEAYGGTGQSSYAVGDLLYADGAASLARLADVAVGNVLLSGGVG